MTIDQERAARYMAISLAGHDKGRIYVVLEEEEEELQVADGHYRGLENPKRKNKKHVQIIKEFPIGVANLLEESRTIRNEDVRRAIKLYRQEVTGCQKQM